MNQQSPQTRNNLWHVLLECARDNGRRTVWNEPVFVRIRSTRQPVRILFPALDAVMILAIIFLVFFR